MSLTPHEEDPEVLSPEELDAPDEVRRMVGSAFESYRGPAHMLPLRKVTGEHITEMLRQDGEEQRFRNERHKFDRKIYLGIVGAILVFLTFLVVWLSDRNPQLLEDLVKQFTTFALGLAAGAGGATYLHKRHEPPQ